MTRGLGPLLALVLATPAAAARLDVVVDGIEPGAGPVYVTVCRGGLSERDCTVGDEGSGRGASRAFRFDGLAPGEWAVAAYQDANGNGRLDRTRLGLPLEPYGLSGAAARRARPDYASARFGLGEPGGTVRVRLGRALPAR